MNMKDAIFGWLGYEKSSTVTKSQEVPLAYVDGNTFREWKTTAISNPYRQNGTIKRAVDIMAFNLAQLPFNVYSGKSKIVSANSVSRLLEKPNETTSAFKFKLIHWSYYLLYDKVYWFLNTNPSGTVVELHVLNPRIVKEKRGADGRLAYYEYGKIKMMPHEVIEFSGFNPMSTTGLGGVSLLDTLKVEYETDDSAAKYGNKFFKNGTRVSGVISGNEDATLEDVKKVINEWKAAHQGTDNAYKVAALLGGMKYEEIGMTMKDAEYIEGRKQIKERIIEAYGIPKSIFGIVEKIDRATAETQMRQFWQVTLKPLAILMQEDINTLLLSKQKEFSRYNVKYDFSVVEELKKDVNETLDAAKKAFELGWNRDELVERFKLDLPTGGEASEERYLPSSLTPINKKEEVVVEEDTIDDDIKKTIDSFFIGEDMINFSKALEKKLKRHIMNYRSKAIKLVDKGLPTADLKHDMDIALVKLIAQLYNNVSHDADASTVKGVITINSAIDRELKNVKTVDDVRKVFNFANKEAKTIARTESEKLFDITGE